MAARLPQPSAARMAGAHGAGPALQVLEVVAFHDRLDLLLLLLPVDVDAEFADLRLQRTILLLQPLTGVLKPAASLRQLVDHAGQVELARLDAHHHHAECLRKSVQFAGCLVGGQLPLWNL